MKYILWNHKRWLPLIIYTVLAVWLWLNRTVLVYSRLPVLSGPILYDSMLASLILLVFVCIFQQIRCPVLTKARVDYAFNQAGLKNGIGQHPTLISVTADPNKKHGKRYTIKNVGISMEDIDRKIDNLQRELGAIYEISYAPNTRRTYLFVLPGKAILPTIPPTAYDDDF